jgi:eukaryotic-like serine/threonine-protein kinase
MPCPPPATNERALQEQVRRALQEALAKDPLFSPLAELTLSTERTLGQGGMGVVHLVHDRRLDRPAALKLLIAEDARKAARFRREAVVTARLCHPGIPPVYEAGRTAAGQHWLLMRYVEGKSLAEAIEALHGDGATRAQRVTGARDLLHALVKVAEAVAYAHSKGVVHRDLKPQNIMLGPFGEALVMDWGLARLTLESAKDDQRLRGELAKGATLPDDVALTVEGATLGTLGYMSPEQARGEDVDETSDVFALGAILCAIISGTPPWPAADSATHFLAMNMEGVVELPRVDPALPAELASIARRALGRRPRERYRSVQPFADDLLAALEGRRSRRA